jgi:hypothetical protein
MDVNSLNLFISLFKKARHRMVIDIKVEGIIPILAMNSRHNT